LVSLSLLSDLIVVTFLPDLLVLRVFFLEVVSKLILCGPGAAIQIDFIVIHSVCFGLLVGILGIILSISFAEILQLLECLLFFAIGTLVELIGRAAIVVVLSKHLSDSLIFGCRVVLLVEARAAVVDYQDALFVLIDIVVMVRTVRVEEQEFDFVPLLVNGLLGEVDVAATIDEDDAAQAAGVVRIVFVRQREQLVGQMRNGEHRYRNVLHLIRF
jgi:hypothetical protein